ncbi:DUF3576 domain-containing protein [Acetobacteraceae bacterium KSS8]|uniref:DUF3576 domain-containing protein n=1 Tax=Endosaccharibacter trunci TaxID=2812733 RepID=A0ABT1WAV5_9PROT|nr:DUF3576 domain-containing protein [Acetobacteraceae bacterium KSS8]
MLRLPARSAFALRSIAGAILLSGLAACGHGSDSSSPIAGDTAALATPVHDNHLMGDGSGSNGGDQNAPGVNAYLWRAAIDTLSFMPFSAAEPQGGIIITDWYSPPTTSGERFKANAYVLGKALRSDNIRVSVFRQVKQDGEWVDQPVAPNTSADITSKILARARQLRADAGGAN